MIKINHKESKQINGVESCGQPNCTNSRVQNIQDTDDDMKKPCTTTTKLYGSQIYSIQVEGNHIQIKENSEEKYR